MAIIFSDNFTGTTIDTGKWNETDPNSRISQNNSIIFTFPHTSTDAEMANNLLSVSTISSGVAVAQANLTWTTDGSAEAIAQFGLYKDSNNYAVVQSRNNDGGKYRLNIKYNGSIVYDLDSTDLPAKGKDIKVWTDGTSIKFFYWNTSVWTQFGTTQTYSLGYNLKVVLNARDVNEANGCNPANIDDVYFSDEDYSTQYPSSTTAYTLAMATGTFTLTGNATIFTKGFTLLCNVGSYILTGFQAIFTKTGWTNDTKPTSSWSNDTKPTSSWTNDSK